MDKACIICGGRNNRVIFTESNIGILKCPDCGHIFSSYDQDQDYDEYFGKVEAGEHFWWDEAHRKMYDDFCRRFMANKSGRLLDAGCGLGYFVKKASSCAGWDVFGCEISGAAAEYARNNLGLKNVFSGRVEEADFPVNYFDIITLWDVIEHLPDPAPMLTYLHAVLKDDGLLFIHTPNIKVQLPKAKLKKLIFGIEEGVHYLEAKDHINIYSEGTLRKILNKYGFTRAEFIHLPPIQSVSGSKNMILKHVKNIWSHTALCLHLLTGRMVNLDNLFAIARKRNMYRDK